MATYSVSSILAPAGSSAAVGPYTQTYTGGANVGDYVFFHFVSSGVTSLNAPTDSVGNTYVIAAQASNASLRNGMAWTRVTKPIIANVTTVNANAVAASFRGSAAFVVTPQSSDLMLEPDKAVIHSSQTTATPDTGSSGTLATPFEIAVAFYGWASGDTFAETASWTNPQGAGGKMTTTTTVVSAAHQVLFPTANTALNPLATLGASVAVGGGIVTFRLANVYSYKPPIGSTPFAGPLAARPMTRLRQYPQASVTAVTGDQTINPTGIASTATIGSPSVTPGPVTISPVGIDSTATIGVPTVTSVYTINPTAIGSTASIGAPTVSPGEVIISPAGIASGSSVGAPTVTSLYTILPASIASTSSVGSPTISSLYTISPTAIGSTAAIGAPTVTTPTGDQTISPASITSHATVGSPVVSGGVVRQSSVAFDNEGRPMLRIGPNLYHPL